MTTSVIKINGMTCEGCTKAVVDTLGEVPGVEEVKADLASGDVTIEHDDIDETYLAAILEGIGFELA